ncbi:MAG: thioredoxin fold domain-containing protein [Mariniblastus sp.]
MKLRTDIPHQSKNLVTGSLSSLLWQGTIGLIAIMIACCSAPLISNCHADDEGFTDDAKAAIARALKEEKEIIFLFTGSDWCPPCKKLEEEVLAEKEFLFEVTKHYVLVKFDFLRKSPVPPELQKQNDEYSKKYGVESFPTLVLTDNKLKPFAFAGYEAGGFQNYLALLENARQLRINRDKFLKEAEGKSGAERAKSLDKAIGEMRTEIINVYYTDIVEEIVALDKDNELGLREKWNAGADAEMRKVIMTDLVMSSRIQKPELAIKFMDEVMEEIDFSPAEKLQIYQMKLNLVKKSKDNARTDALLDEMIGLEGVEGETKERLIVKKIYLMVGSGRHDEAMKLLDKSIKSGDSSMYLFLAKGELHNAKKEYDKAITAYDLALKTARSNPDVMIDLVSAKADAEYSMDNAIGAMQTLDNFSEDTQMPADLRGEALLHKAMIMRDMKRTRQAMLAENRAIEVAESTKERSEMQKIVDSLRKKYKK